MTAVLGVWAAPMQKLDSEQKRQLRGSLNAAALGGSDVDGSFLRSVSSAWNPLAYRELKHGRFSAASVPQNVARRQIAKRWNGGRRAGMTCGGEGQEQCVCHEDLCCAAPEEVRSSFETYEDEWETLTGRSVRVACHNGHCNVTVGKVTAPGCEDLNCLLDVCQVDDPKACSIFTPQYCTSCER